MRRISYFIAVACLTVASCSPDEEAVGFRLITYTTDFSVSKGDWQPGFCDYPAGPDDSTFYELEYAYTERPSTAMKSFMLSGNNHSDDLFMYLKEKVTGLDPNTQYTITFEVEFASNAKEDELGAGGAPGKGVYMKMGATSTEPKSLVVGDNYVMNIDKGNQSQSGRDVIVIGDIAVPYNADGYVLTTRTNAPYSNNSYDIPFIANSNSDGEMWFIVGTDSGFEGITTLYYTKITVVLSKSN